MSIQLNPEPARPRGRLRRLPVFRLMVFGLLALTALPCLGEKHLSVAQLEQLLAEAHAKHKQDFDIARQIAGVALTERIPDTSFARLNALLDSSPQASLALRLLADQSDFLDLPAGETAPLPESAAQTRMLQAARNYLSETLGRLPNFLATRTINLFDDTPRPLRQGEWPTRAGLHPVGTSRSEISVSREREDQPPSQGSAVWQSKTGLLSGGEFGTTVGMILTDSAQGSVIWDRWERGPPGMLAVFRYAVPSGASHFEVISSYQREANLEGVRTAPDARGVAGIGVRPNVHSGNVEVVRSRPAYHGAIWLNPADGAIFRVTMEADTSKDLPFRRAAILVEYGSVEIAGSRFICPVRSLALSQKFATAESITGDAATQWLNETIFTDYHRFASSSRIVEEAGATPPRPPAPPPAASQAQAEPAAQPAMSPGESSPISTPEAASEERRPTPPPLAPSAAPGEVPTTSSLATPSNRSSSPIAGAPVAEEDSLPARAIQPGPSGFTLHVDVNSLLVPAVVLDKAGRAVSDLDKKNFIVLDNGKRSILASVTTLHSAPRTSQDDTKGEGSTAAPADTRGMPSKRGATPGPRFIIFLFDDRHMTTADLPLVQKAASDLLKQGLQPGDYAAVLSFMGQNSGITRDSEVLRSAVMKLSVHQASQTVREDCPRVDYYSADQIINQHNPIEFQIASQEAKQCSFVQDQRSIQEDPYRGINDQRDPFQRAAMSAATRALALGEEDARESLLSVENVVRAMAKLAGQRILIVISPGFLTLSAETMAQKSEIMDAAAASDVIVNALDARGLYAGNIDASEGGTTSILSLVTGQPGQNKLASLAASEDVMSELAMGTGGRFFHNSNDLKGGLEMLSAAPESLYLLEISLKDVKANGAYHRLQVKVDRPGLEVVARRGYLAPKQQAHGNPR